MRFMIIVKASAASEAGVMPTVDQLVEMNQFNEQLVKAGILLGGEGLHPSSKGARIQFKGGRKTLVDGPFAETKELVAGFWLIEVKSREEAIEWFKRVPNPHFGDDAEIELRQVFSAEDFGHLQAEAPEVFEAERRFREEQEARAGRPQSR
jgi:hypothetical protein